jgi:hypothetical protein
MGGKDQEQTNTYEPWGPQGDLLKSVYGGAQDVLGRGRVPFMPQMTPFGPTPWLGAAGMPEAAGLGFGAYMQGGNAYNALTDPNLMLNVSQNPYVMGAVDAAANEAQRRTSASAFGSGNYGGGAHQRAAAGAIADVSNQVMNQAYSQGLGAMARGASMMPGFAGTPMNLMQGYQESDWDWLDRAKGIAGNPPATGSSTSTMPGNPIAGAIGGASIGKGIWDWGVDEGWWGGGGGNPGNAWNPTPSVANGFTPIGGWGGGFYG